MQVNTNEALIYALTGYRLDPKPPTQLPPGDLADNVGEHDESDFNDDEGDEDEDDA